MNQLKGLAAVTGLVLILTLVPAAVGHVYADTPHAVQKTATPESKNPHPRHPHPPFRHLHGGHIVKDTADLLGMEPKDIMEQLKQGKTLLQIAQVRKGWSEEEYLKKLTDTASRNIDKAVAENKIDAEKASRLKAILPEKFKRVIHRTWKDNHSGHPALDYQNNQIHWVKPSANP
ncbi:hypothetical protein DFP94_102138 [Fontibacillus phaseoli]|uniref:Uncharacterized protein n=1 Tax=Fontibacillus phaseoli TaxID=1416533 RepID=A0A369BIH7_9BACL|nr:hypothetical protein [Fontibacillus phaseoli]RCX21390.1 hypothetical protein DFP94_102138 [Fontibacillus phaseoli]